MQSHKNHLSIALFKLLSQVLSSLRPARPRLEGSVLVSSVIQRQGSLRAISNDSLNATIKWNTSVKVLYSGAGATRITSGRLSSYRWVSKVFTAQMSP